MLFFILKKIKIERINKNVIIFYIFATFTTHETRTNTFLLEMYICMTNTHQHTIFKIEKFLAKRITIQTTVRSLDKTYKYILDFHTQRRPRHCTQLVEPTSKIRLSCFHRTSHSRNVNSVFDTNMTGIILRKR